VTRGDELRLADIVDACREMSEVVAVGRDAFLADRIRVRAAERLLEVIGEAANALGVETTDEYPEVNWRDITRLRIVLAHHYQRVDSEQVWNIAVAEVPALLLAISPGEIPG
jgi:uncharacterized protein with HEPN domain